MDKTLTLEAGTEKEAGLKGEIEEMFAEMDTINARIEANQAETARLRAETWMILNQLKAA